MIKFFRKIRQNLLSESKFSKYLLYAIGEIILVVIGILFAVSINEWNVNRKNQQQIDQLLVAFQKDLKVNIEAVNRHVDILTLKDSIIEQILQRKVTAEMYYEKTIRPMILSYHRVDIITENLDRLLDKEAQLKIEAAPLLKLLKEYSLKLDIEAKDKELIINYVLEQNRFLVNNMPWYNAYKDSTSMEAATYFTKDEIYINKTRFYQTLWNNNYGRTIAERQNIELLLLYNLLKLQKKESSVHNVFAGLDFYPMTKVECATKDKILVDEKYHAPFILNVGTDTLDISMEYNLSGVLGTRIFHIGPGEYETRSGFTSFTINVMENDSCVTTYLPSTHSYLILGEE